MLAIEKAPVSNRGRDRARPDEGGDAPFDRLGGVDGGGCIQGLSTRRAGATMMTPGR